jgi:hypothetical protein
MKRLHFTIYLALLGVLLSSCQVFPYAYETSIETPIETTASTATPQPTSTQMLPTATLEVVETEEFTATSEETLIESAAETTLNFIVQEGNPAYMANFANPDEGCDWMGIAGQVFDEDGDEIPDLVLVAGNALDENGTELSSLTGTAQAYGPGGYEIKLSDTALDTSQVFWVEVRNAEGLALSERVFFDTFAVCEKNLILVNFIQQSEEAKAQPASEATPTLEAYP